MTVSSSTGRQFTINEMVAKAYKYAGLLNLASTPTEQEYQFGRDLLEDILDSLPAEGEQARAVSFSEVSITAAQVTAETYKFDLPSSVLDLLDPAMYIDAAETDTDRASGEVVMRLIGLEEWHRLSEKSATGTPLRYAAYRVGDTLQAWVWPIPNQAGTIRFRVHRHLADADAGNATFDLKPYWMDFIKKRLAADLADSSSLPHTKIARMEAKASEALRKARGKANQRGGTQVYVTHRGPYG